MKSKDQDFWDIGMETDDEDGIWNMEEEEDFELEDEEEPILEQEPEELKQNDRKKIKVIPKEQDPWSVF